MVDKSDSRSDRRQVVGKGTVIRDRRLAPDLFFFSSQRKERQHDICNTFLSVAPWRVVQRLSFLEDWATNIVNITIFYNL